MFSVSKRAGLTAGAIPLLLLATSVQARELKADFSDASAATLTAGDYMWDTSGADDLSVRIVISLPLQRAFVFQGGALVGMAAVSTGRDGHETPAGEFTILAKDKDHHSNLYNDAAMPYMLRLTWDGIAIHAGHNPGYADSHGCIRVPMEFAKKLFAIAYKGAEVTVTDQVVDPLSPPAVELAPSPSQEMPVPMIAAADDGTQPTLRRISYSEIELPAGY
jgi:hypothetical protein